MHDSPLRTEYTQAFSGTRPKRAGICVFSLAAVFVYGCGGKAKIAKIASSNVHVGDCVDAERAGVLSDSPDLRSAHRDLNGDGKAEKVYADRRLCRRGNCYWNLFVKAQGCDRYIGTVSGETLEILDLQSDAGFHEIRGWWKLPRGKRHVVQSYLFREDGYLLNDVIICQGAGGSALICADEEPKSSALDD